MRRDRRPPRAVAVTPAADALAIVEMAGGYRIRCTGCSAEVEAFIAPGDVVDVELDHDTNCSVLDAIRRATAAGGN
jgi:hypothetical protein